MKLVSFLRSFFMSLLYPIVVMIMSSLCILFHVIFESRKIDDWFMQTWGRWSCAMFGVKVVIRGSENIPSTGCIFLFNHTSFFDIFAMSAAIPGLRYGAKIELFKIPFFGSAMKAMDILPIDRGNRERVFHLYKESEIRIKHGEKFALAPEGTRQTEEKIGDFKAGPFVFAINSKAPLVPLVIKNALPIMPKHTIFPNADQWSRTITIDILPSIKTVDIDLTERPALQARIKEKMEEVLNWPTSLHKK